MLAAGAGLGLLKQREQAKQAQQQNILNAYTQLYSPWTGLKAGPQQFAPSLLGSVGEGAVQGYGFGQDMEDRDSQRDLVGAQTNYYNRLNRRGSFGPPQVV